MRLNGQNMPGMIISVLLTIPIVTDCESASGLPRASTRSPTFSFVTSPNVATGNLRGVVGPQAEHGDVRQRIGADELGGNLFAVGERAGDRARAPGDVMVGDDVAVRRDDGAAARRLALELAAVLKVDRDDVDADQARRDFGEGRLDLGGLFRRWSKRGVRCATGPTPAPATPLKRDCGKHSAHAAILSRMHRGLGRAAGHGGLGDGVPRSGRGNLS